MRKLFSMLLGITMLFTLSAPALAAPPTPELDVESILREAVLVTLDGEELDLGGTPVIHTRQVSNVNARGVSGEVDYVSSVAIDIDFTETKNELGETVLTPRANYSKEEVETHGSNMRIYTTIYWSTGEVYDAGAYVPYVKLTRVSSTYERLDTTCQVSNKCLRYQYAGYDLDDDVLDNYTSPWYTTTNYSVTAPHLEATPDGMYFEICGESKCTLTRGNQTWDLITSCYLNSYE